MARRVGSEVIEHWTVRTAFNKPRQETLAREYRGCWPQFNAGAEEGAVLSTAAGFWIPADFPVLDAEDFLVWRRYPGERYGVEGEVNRWYTRRGQLRACYVPVERIASEAS